MKSHLIRLIVVMSCLFWIITSHRLVHMLPNLYSILVPPYSAIVGRILGTNVDVPYPTN